MVVAVDLARAEENRFESKMPLLGECREATPEREAFAKLMRTDARLCTASLRRELKDVTTGRPKNASVVPA